MSVDPAVEHGVAVNEQHGDKWDKEEDFLIESDSESEEFRKE